MRIFCGHLNIVLTRFESWVDPNTGEEAKDRAKAKLEEHGVEVDE